MERRKLDDLKTEAESLGLTVIATGARGNKLKADYIRAIEEHHRKQQNVVPKKQTPPKAPLKQSPPKETKKQTPPKAPLKQSPPKAPLKQSPPKETKKQTSSPSKESSKKNHDLEELSQLLLDINYELSPEVVHRLTREGYYGEVYDAPSYKGITSEGYQLLKSDQNFLDRLLIDYYEEKYHNGPQHQFEDLHLGILSGKGYLNDDNDNITEKGRKRLWELKVLPENTHFVHESSEVDKLVDGWAYNTDKRQKEFNRDFYFHSFKRALETALDELNDRRRQKDLLEEKDSIIATNMVSILQGRGIYYHSQYDEDESFFIDRVKFTD